MEVYAYTEEILKQYCYKFSTWFRMILRVNWGVTEAEVGLDNKELRSLKPDGQCPLLYATKLIARDNSAQAMRHGTHKTCRFLCSHAFDRRAPQ